jgi:hypothetical protein
MKKIAFAMVLALSSFSAMAGEVYGQIGTEGLGLGYAQPVNDVFSVRGEINNYSKSFTQSSDDMDYAGNIKLGGVSVLADYFPFASNLRVTSGVIVNNGKVSGSASPTGGAYTINGTRYAYVAGDSVTANVKFGNVSPYLGIGYGHARQTKGLGFFADIGVIFQKPESTITLSGTAAARVSAADIAAERASLQDSVDKFKAYPVLKVGASYSF